MWEVNNFHISISEKLHLLKRNLNGMYWARWILVWKFLLLLKCFVYLRLCFAEKLLTDLCSFECMKVCMECKTPWLYFKIHLGFIEKFGSYIVASVKNVGSIEHSFRILNLAWVYEQYFCKFVMLTTVYESLHTLSPRSELNEKT